MVQQIVGALHNYQGQVRMMKSKMHKTVVLLLLVLFSASATSQTKEAPSSQSQGSGQPVLACSTTQVADFARQVAGDQWDVRCVLAPGQDPHMYQLQQDAVALVRRATLCLDNGMHLEGDDWMRTLATQEKKPIVSCTNGIKPLQLDEDGKTVNDPHAWFSAQNAAVYVRNVRNALVQHDPKNQAAYDARTSLFLAQLKSLDAWAKREINKIPPAQRVLVTSHDAFNYFCQAYGFQAAAPVGWSTGEIGGEETPESRRLVIESIRKAAVPAIFVETSVNGESIKAIAKEAGVEVGGRLYSDSMGGPGSAGESYVGMMRENVITIVTALTGK